MSDHDHDHEPDPDEYVDEDAEHEAFEEKKSARWWPRPPRAAQELMPPGDDLGPGSSARRWARSCACPRAASSTRRHRQSDAKDDQTMIINMAPAPSTHACCGSCSSSTATVLRTKPIIGLSAHRHESRGRAHLRPGHHHRDTHRLPLAAPHQLCSPWPIGCPLLDVELVLGLCVQIRMLGWSSLRTPRRL